ncbi:hypothetical protein [Pseudomonas cyclaminis]|uniref:Lhr family helicase n=1 Tax=Pseudomonas cyclaminis TaxID=2781239 RepID=UPI0038094550
MLDELIAAGTVLWSGHGQLGENDGLVALHLLEFASETQSPLSDNDSAVSLSILQQHILSSLANGGAYFVRQLATLAASGLLAEEPAPTTSDIHAALWDLAWSGYVTADTWSPLRAYYGGRPTRRSRPAPAARRRRGFRGFSSDERMSTTSDPTLSDPTLAGRWSLLHLEPINDTTRALALVEGLLDRYGVVTRSAAMTEESLAGFRPYGQYSEVWRTWGACCAGASSNVWGRLSSPSV